jgi:N-acetylmuramoyl-L-alanine amidase
VVIDPGHGGRDPGTIGVNGIQEKNLVLDISRRVSNMLRVFGEFETIMTRSDDRFIPLEERTAIANSSSADLFVSIHANASGNRRARGIETYYLNLAASPWTQEVAARENALSPRRLGELQELLRMVVNNNRIAESREFAHHVQTAMMQGARLNGAYQTDLGVKTAPFVVLLEADMPSILVEVSFLSNPDDADLLASESYVESMARAIALGIRRYSNALKQTQSYGDAIVAEPLYQDDHYEYP